MKSIFVFFHVGDDCNQPQMLVDSIRLTNQDCEIIYCSNSHTPAIQGVTRRINVEGNVDNLMSYRLKAFSEIGVDSPALYVDTDMLFCRKIEPGRLLGEKKF